MTRDRHITGMSLTETLLAAVVIALLLSGLVVASNSLRTGIADRQTRETLQKLQVSLAKYHEMHHRYPEGPTEAAMAALMKDAHTRAIAVTANVASSAPRRIVTRMLVLPVCRECAVTR